MFENPAQLFVQGTNPVVTTFQPTHPLTVTNNLEGGTGGQYKVTWDKKQNEPATLNSGSSYNAFEFNQQNLDRHTIEALNFTALNTNWYFQNWNTGSTDNIISDYQVTAPTSLTTNYKGNLRSNQSDAFTSNSQRKLIRDNNGIYHCVYTSMDKLWYTKSLTTDFNGTWSQEQQITAYGFTNEHYEDPSIDFYGSMMAIVFEIHITGESTSSVVLVEMNLTNGTYQVVDTTLGISNIGNANPVVSYNQYHRIYIYDKTSSDGLNYKRNYFLSGSSWSGWSSEAIIPNTASISKNPSIVAYKGTVKDFHFVWQQGTSQIRYSYIYEKTDHTIEFKSYSIISSGNGYTTNEFPSISLTNNNYSPVVSWTVKRKEDIDKSAIYPCIIINQKSSPSLKSPLGLSPLFSCLKLLKL